MNGTVTNASAGKLIEVSGDWMAEAAEIAMHYYGMDMEAAGLSAKQDDSPLTKADIEIDGLLLDRLTQTFPDIPVVTEERSASHGLNVGDSPFFLVDPIDGTKEFINKRGDFTVNIALVAGRAPVAGIVAAPALGKLYTGIVGQGALLTSLGNGKAGPICVRQPDNEALLVVASRSHLSAETQAFIAANKVADTRNAGSSLKFCLLAEGEADLYPRFGPTMEWDTAAGHAVLLAAGGFVNDTDGKALVYGKPEFRNGWFIAGVDGVSFTGG